MAEVVEVLLRAKMEASGVETGINQIKNSLKGLSLPKGISDDLEKSFSKLTPLLKDYQKQLNKGFSNKKDLQNFNTLKEKINEVFSDIESQVQKANSEEIRLKVDTQEIDRLEKQIASKMASLQKTLDSVVTKNFNFDSITKKFEEKTKGISSATVTAMWGKASDAFQAQDYIKYNQILDETRNKILSFSKIRFDFAKSLGFNGKKTDIEDITRAIDDFFNSIKVNSGQVQRISRTKEEIEKLKNTAKDLKFDSLGTGKKALEGLEGTLNTLIGGFKRTGSAATEAVNGVVRMSEEVNQLKTSTQYFFSLRNMINLFKRGVQEAVQTVKELDAAMTETAVVTKYSVADMWGKLPQYTAMANKLGGTIKGAYETTTLYYQQGLDTDAAMGIGEETIKMARIAGLDYAETTDMMTAALRGFNMELNNLSAQHINDVYSQLAAKTASNTQEIGSAMERTASIAHSAGMSFEGTSAFLAQMIETTREAPENLGTAMKTIIARFQELKKDPMDMEEVDGELPDYNKVDTALKSIGVDLKNQRGEFRALDEVFIDIAKRWDSLDQRQQRYVATTAAGSRQQSRFIAMMNNYERTAELMEYANDSAGASQEQFNKTLDSFEAKANKLKNAWDQFLMGITDNKIIKGGLDLLTGIITTVNKLIDTVSGGFGPLKSFLSLFTAFAGLKIGGGLINRLIGGLGGMLDPRSSFRKGFGVGATGFSSTQASQITNPIVSVLEQIRSEVSVIKTKDNTDKTKELTPKQALENYRNVNQKFRSLNSNNTLNDVVDTLKLTDEKQSQLILNNSPGVRSQIKRTFQGIMSNKAFDKQMQESGSAMVDELFEGMQKGTISTKDGLAIFKDFSKAGKVVGTETAKEFSIAYNKKLYENGNGKAIRQKALNSLKIGGLDQQQLIEYFTDSKEGQARLKEYREAFAKEREAAAKQKFGGSFGTIKLPDPTKYEKIAQGVSAVGSGFVSAGQAASTFGMILNSMGLESAGAAFMSLGNIISSVGMTMANLVPTIANYGSKIVSFITNPAFLAAAIPTALIAGAVIADKVMEKKARETAEKVTETYQKAMDDTSKKLDVLESNKDILNNLSSGVDKFGNNVSLTADEYEQFLTASREVAEVSPSLIKGYTAQGDAIVATGQALDDLIDKEKEYQNLARETYVSSSSLNDLAKGVEVSDEFKKYKDTANYEDPRNSYLVHTDFGYLSNELETLHKAFTDFDLDGKNVIKQVTGFNVDLENLTSESALIIAKYSEQIKDASLESLREQLYSGEIDREYYDKAESQLQDGLSAFTTGWNDILAGAQPLTDAISQYLTSQNLDAAGLQLSEEFVTSFNEGMSLISLDLIASGDTSGEAIQKAAREYANNYKDAVGEGSKYAQIMEQINKAQAEFSDYYDDTNAVDIYNKSIEGSVEALRNLAEQMDDGTEAGRQLSAMFNEQANEAEKWAADVHFSLSETLNTLSDEFAKARGEKEAFDKAIEGGDYYTAAEGFKSIYETVTSDENMQGYGSQSFWIGSESLLGKEYIDTHNLKEIKERLLEIEPLLADGTEGFNAFYDEIEKHKNELADKGLIDINKATGEFSLDIDKSTEHLKDFAEILEIDEDLLAALIDKARQFVPIDTMDPEGTRAALSEDERVMQGSSTDKNGKQTLYVSDAVIETEAHANGIYGESYTNLIKDLSAENVKVLKSEDLINGIDATNGLLKDIGLSGSNSLNDAVKVFSKMGFTLDETKNILSKDKKGLEISGSEEEIEKAWNENAYAIENPTVAEINSTTSGILDNTSAMLVAMGIMTDSIGNKIDKVTDSGYVEKVKNNLLDSDGKIKTFESKDEYDKANNAVQAQIQNYESLIETLEKGQNTLSETDPLYNIYQDKINQLNTAKGELQKVYDLSNVAWAGQLASARENYKGVVSYDTLGANEYDQGILNERSIEIKTIFDSENIEQGLEGIKQLQAEGELSDQTIQNLGLSLIALDPKAFLDLDEASRQTYLDLLNLEQEGDILRNKLTAPFSLEVMTNSEEGLQQLAQHLNELGLTGEKNFAYREIIFDPKLIEQGGAAQVTAFLDKIDEQFGNGDSSQKVMLIEAAMQLGAGNDAQAMEILTQAYGGQAEEVRKKVDILVDGSVVNADEFKGGIQSEIDSLNEDGYSVNADVITNIVQGDSEKANITLDLSKDVAEQDLESFRSAQKDAPVDINIDANTDEANQAVNNFITDTNSKTATVQVKAAWVGGAIPGRAKGQHNTLPIKESISFDSFAGGYNGPGRKGSKITALTGEKGYEVAWIPSENRSTILGATGPEIATFPADTVIYNHEQSKKILKGNKNKVDLGSFAGGNNRVTSGAWKKWSTDKTVSKPGTSSSSSPSNKGKSNSSDDKDKHTTINNWSIEEVYRFEVENKIKNYQNQIDKWGKKINDLFDRIGTKTSSISKTLNNEKKGLQNIIKENNNLVKSYKKDLNKLADGSYKTKISYTPNGSSESKEQIIDLSKYIYHNKKTGTYGISRKAIRANTSDPAKQEAIFNAAESALSPLLSGLDSARKAADKAREDLNDLDKQVYETFYGWENELTRIYNVNQKINQYGNIADRAASQVELIFARVGAGVLSSTKAITQMNAAVKKENTAIENRILQAQEMVKAEKQALTRSISDSDERAELQRARKSGNKTWIQQAEDNLKAANLTDKFTKYSYNKDGTANITVDWEKLEKARNNGEISEKTYQAIKDRIDDMINHNESLEEAMKSETGYLVDVYNQLEEYRQTMVDMEDTLLKQLEEDAKEHISTMKNLSSSITNSIKDILDEVKKKLQDRRQAEDNAKTERDISQKQQRLNALRANTSGGNQVEIAQLEKEIAEAQQSYGRTLEDQLLDKLQQQGDMAAKQRDRQIEIAEAQLELQRENNKKQIETWLQNPTKYKSQIKQLWLEANGYDEKGKYGQEQLDDMFEKDFVSFVEAQRQLNGNISTSLESVRREIETKLGTIINNQNTAMGLDKAKTTAQSGYNNLVKPGGKDEATKNKETAKKTFKAIKDKGYSGKEAVQAMKNVGFSNALIKQAGATARQMYDTGTKSVSGLKKAGYNARQVYALHEFNWDEIKKVYGSDTSRIMTNTARDKIAAVYAKKKGGWSDAKLKEVFGTNQANDIKTQAKKPEVVKKYKKEWATDYSYEKMKKKNFFKYKTGGLADYTGPAWLDGTPSKPEIILDAADTKNFVQLRDILASIMRGNTFDTPVAAGDTNIEVNINVDHIANDYDVDKLAKRIKRDIVKDSSYRNVTSAKKIR